MMGYQNDLAMPAVYHIGDLHQPGLDLWKGDKVVGFVNEDRAIAGQNKVENYVQADQTSLAVGELIQA